MREEERGGKKKEHEMKVIMKASMIKCSQLRCRRRIYLQLVPTTHRGTHVQETSVHQHTVEDLVQVKGRLADVW